MLLFLDNDIILKLSSAGLLKEIEKIYSCTVDNIFFLPSAKYYFANSSSIKKKYSQQTIDNALKSIKNYSAIPDKFIDDNRFVELVGIEGIDSGEQILFSVSIPNDEYLILTGDKKAVTELAKTGIAETMTEKIVCLEEIFLKLIDLLHFDELLVKIKDSDYCKDTVIKICFNQPDLTKSEVEEGLKSYLNELKSNTGSLLYSG